MWAAGLAALVSLCVGAALWPARAVVAQTNPSPRPPIDQTLTALAPPPTSPSGGGPTSAPATLAPGQPSPTATIVRPRVTRTPTATQTDVPTATPTPTQPTQTPFVIEQTVVQTVVQVVVETVVVSGTPIVVTVPPVETEATAPAANTDVPWWLWLLILFPLLALLVGLWLLRARGVFWPGLYPLHGRPWQAQPVVGRRRPRGRDRS
jgi:hypothetical protein